MIYADMIIISYHDLLVFYSYSYLHNSHINQLQK